MISPPARMASRSSSRRSRSDVVAGLEPREVVPPAIRAPGALLLALEGRAPWEFVASVVAAPWLRRLPRGDGHRVLVLPGLFVAGEMLDWEAPTGGYLLTACLATGRAAGQGAARWLEMR